MESVVDFEELPKCTDATKMMHAMAIFQAVASSVQQELSMKNYSVAYALSSALKYWERR